MKRLPVVFVLLIVLFSAAPAMAASSFYRFWTGFTQFWGQLFGTVSGVVGVVLLCGAAGLFIITRGKWLK